MSMNMNVVDMYTLENRISIGMYLSKVYSTEELEDIIHELLNFNFSYKRKIDDPDIIILNKTFDSGCEIQLIDHININTYPIERYIDIIIKNNIKGISDNINCKVTKNTISYIAYAFGLAVNYSTFRSYSDNNYNRNHIINNCCKRLSDITSIETLKDMKFIIEFINNEKSIITDDKFSYSFDLDNIRLNITSTTIKLIRFEFKNLDDTENIQYNIIYFRKTPSGLLNLMTMIDKAIINKQ